MSRRNSAYIPHTDDTAAIIMCLDDGDSVNACYKSFMRFLFYIIIPLCMAGLLPNTAVQAAARDKKPSITQLEQQLAEIEIELAELASFSMRSGVGAVGFRSKDHPDPRHTEWIQIELGETKYIDQVVLVPAIWRNPKSSFQAEGFPIEFQLLAGNAETTNVVATFSVADNLVPRVAPLAVSFPETPASWVRIEASLLSPRAWDGRYLLQLSEVLVFSGMENVALRHPVETSSIGIGAGRARIRESLVDGFVPYLMDAAQGEQSIAFMSPVGIGDQPTLSLDLGASHLLNRIHLHTPELSDTVPQSSEPGHGIPKHLLIVGANRPDFSDAALLTEYRMNELARRHELETERPDFVNLVIFRPHHYIQSGRSLLVKRGGATQLQFLSKCRPTTTFFNSSRFSNRNSRVAECWIIRPRSSLTVTKYPL